MNCLILIDWLWSKKPIPIIITNYTDIRLTYFFPIQLLFSLFLVHYNILSFLCAIFYLHGFFFFTFLENLTVTWLTSSLMWLPLLKARIILCLHVTCPLTINKFQSGEKTVCILWLFFMHVLCKKCVLIYKLTSPYISFRKSSKNARLIQGNLLQSEKRIHFLIISWK